MKMTIALLFAVFLAVGSPLRAQSGSQDAFTQNRRLGRGVNVLGYDPIWRDNSHARFQEKYFKLIKDAGFSSLRINLQAFRHMNPANGLALSDSWFDVLDWAMKHAQEQDLAVILDLHEFTPMGADPEANKEKFLSFWRQIAARYKDAPDSVYFEVLNEPSRKVTPALWNDYFRQALAIIRETNPTRAVVVGPAFWNSIDHLNELELPDGDRHLIVTVHYYTPMEFTHQGASWTGQQNKLGVDWAGTPDELARLNGDFDKAQAWAKAHDRPIFLGEFGANDKGQMDARVRWTSAVARAAERRGWSWAYWQFDSDFILYDVPHDKWVEPILHALIPASPANP